MCCWTATTRGSLQSSNSVVNLSTLVVEFIKDAFKAHSLALSRNYKRLATRRDIVFVAARLGYSPTADTFLLKTQKIF